MLANADVVPETCDVCAAPECALISRCTHGLCKASGRTCVACAAQHECNHSVRSFNAWASLLLDGGRLSLDAGMECYFGKLAFSNFWLKHRKTEAGIYVALCCSRARTTTQDAWHYTAGLQAHQFQRTLTFADCHVSLINLERSWPEEMQKRYYILLNQYQ